MSNNSGQMDILVSGIVIALLVAMFLSGAFMIVEATSGNMTTSADGKTSMEIEPKKMYFGIAHLVAATLFAIGFLMTMFGKNKNNYSGGGN